MSDLVLKGLKLMVDLLLTNLLQEARHENQILVTAAYFKEARSTGCCFQDCGW